jgi:hypothetical protein
MKVFITVKFEIEGLHNWPDARTAVPEVGFLSDLHMHYFSFTVRKKVSHNERDIEIIQFRRELIDYFKRNYFVESINTHNFGARSCETIAQDLLEAYDLQSCEVLEDNKNGAICLK